MFGLHLRSYDDAQTLFVKSPARNSAEAVARDNRRQTVEMALEVTKLSP